MSANPNDDSMYMTEAEYLEFNRDSEIRHEYIQGEVVAMAGASQNHNRLVATIRFLLYGHLRNKKGCEVYGENMRVKIKLADLQTFPDLSVVCGDIQLTDDLPPALLNPNLIIEVLSPSTESYDRGKKFKAYRQLPSLQEYILVSQDSAHIERYVRKVDLWELSDATGLDATITLSTIDCPLALVDVYENVTFEDKTLASD
mgnify:CR=1 FL=1